MVELWAVLHIINSLLLRTGGRCMQDTLCALVGQSSQNTAQQEQRFSCFKRDVLLILFFLAYMSICSPTYQIMACLLLLRMKWTNISSTERWPGNSPCCLPPYWCTQSACGGKLRWTNCDLAPSPELQVLIGCCFSAYCEK